MPYTPSKENNGGYGFDRASTAQFIYQGQLKISTRTSESDAYRDTLPDMLALDPVDDFTILYKLSAKLAAYYCYLHTIYLILRPLK